MQHGFHFDSGFKPSGMLTPPHSSQTKAPHPSSSFQSTLSPPPTPPAYEYEQPWTATTTYLDQDQRLQYVRTLGSGAYGVVHLAKDVQTQIPYAVKVLSKYNVNGLPLDNRAQLFQRNEMTLHYEVSAHPNIVSLLRILDAPDNTFAILEYCSDGDLFQNIVERHLYVGNDMAAKNIFLQILSAVSHCHNHGVYHRDLKPENILVTDGGHQVKLADFGLATRETYTSDHGCGSQFYMSPECHDQSSGQYASAPNDIWSLGIILVNLTCGRNPWKTASTKDSTFRAYLKDRQFLKSILNLSDELNDILGMIFELDPSRRITLEHLTERIIHCQHFTKPTPAIVTNTILTPSSTTSDVAKILSSGSLMSDHSDNSTAPSEVEANFEPDVIVQVVDEVYQPMCFTDAQSQEWRTPSTFVPSFVPVSYPQASPPVQPKSQWTKQTAYPTVVRLPTPPFEKQSRVPVSRLSMPRRVRQTPARHFVTPSPYSFRRYLPDQRNISPWVSFN